MGRKRVSQIRPFLELHRAREGSRKLTSEEAFSHQFPSTAGEGPEGVSRLPVKLAIWRRRDAQISKGDN